MKWNKTRKLENLKELFTTNLILIKTKTLLTLRLRAFSKLFFYLFFLFIFLFTKFMWLTTKSVLMELNCWMLVELFPSNINLSFFFSFCDFLKREWEWAFGCQFVGELVCFEGWKAFGFGLRYSSFHLNCIFFRKK